MSSAKRRRLESAVAAVRQRYGPSALRRAVELPSPARVPAISTGFPELDALTGCRGLPVGHITLLTGPATSGKLTLAYKGLAAAQRDSRGRIAHAVALVDLSRSTDPDCLARCGVDLDHLLLVRPEQGTPIPALVMDLARSRGVRLLLVDSLADLPPLVLDGWRSSMAGLVTVLRAEGCALLCVDEPAPPWRRWLNLERSASVRQHAALHMDMRRERWLTQEGELTGYRAEARLRYSRWARSGTATPIAIHFNGTVKAARSW